MRLDGLEFRSAIRDKEILIKYESFCIDKMKAIRFMGIVTILFKFYSFMHFSILRIELMAFIMKILNLKNLIAAFLNRVVSEINFFFKYKH